MGGGAGVGGRHTIWLQQHDPYIPKLPPMSRDTDKHGILLRSVR